MFVRTNLVDLHHKYNNDMKVNSFIFLLLTYFMSFGQDYKTCGTVDMVKLAQEQEPQLILNQKKLENQINALLASGWSKNDEIYTIPVVIHVIYSNDNNNISDQQIHDAMRIINEDFTKNNSDTSQIISNFQSQIANVGVTFKLANLDPDGNCTKGITRNYSILTHDAGENVKDIVRWDPRMYLNIWVVDNIASGAGGYSYYPGAAPNNDLNAGIVIRSSQFGSIGASNGGNFSSRSLTHEIGHYLNLKHTWGSTNDNYLEENCDMDDNVDDTPNTIGSNLGCNLNQNTCGSLDNVQNFMDYSSCGKMYSQGQKDRMRAALEVGYIYANAARTNLWTDENLWLTGTHGNYDQPDCLAYVDFEPQSTISCSNVPVYWSNLSYNYDSAYSYLWEFEGGIPNTSTDSNPSVTYNSAGDYTTTLTIITQGGASTKVMENSIHIQDAELSILAPTEYKFTNSNFLSSTNPNDAWYIEENDNGDTWQWDDLSSTSSEGSLRIRSLYYDDDKSRKLYSPIFDLSNVSSPSYLYFDYAYAKRNSATDDELVVNISSNCGTTWQKRLSKDSEDLQTNPNNYLLPFEPSSEEWGTERLSLNSWVGNNEVQVLFEFSGSGGNYLYIDNIQFGVPLLDVESQKINSPYLKIYPNPSNGNSVITFEVNTNSKVRLSLYDLLGREIGHKTNHYSSGTHNISLHSLKQNIKSGSYWLIYQSESHTQTLRIIVN